MAFFYQIAGGHQNYQNYQNYPPTCNECGSRSCQIKYDGTYCAVCRDCYFELNGSSKPSFSEQQKQQQQQRQQQRQQSQQVITASPLITYQYDSQQYGSHTMYFQTQLNNDRINYNTDTYDGGCVGGVCTRPQ